jgi:hypothetical protein
MIMDITDRTPSLDESAPASAYEAALDRMEAARRGWQHDKREAERIVREADDEYYAAEANLRACEIVPGIPLPEYNPYR